MHQHQLAPTSRQFSSAFAFLAVVIALGPTPEEVAAQQLPYPTPRLVTVTPPGAKAGTTVEVTVTGTDLDEATALSFSDPAIKAKRLPDPPPPKDKRKKNAPPPPTRFAVSVPETSREGLHDVRVIGKWGISNPRAFVVGILSEAVEKEPNSDTPGAQRVDLESVVNGVVENRTDVDYFQFEGRKGQTVVFHCAASSIDSRLLAYVQLYDLHGKELGSNKHYRDRDAVLGCTLPEDGDYLVRVSEFAYQGGGPEYFYRLTLSTGPWVDAVYPPVVTPGKPNRVTLYGRNLPGGRPVPVPDSRSPALEQLTVSVTPPANPGGAVEFPGRLLPRCGAVEGFGYRHAGSNPVFLGYTTAPVVLDNEDNDTPETAQDVAVGFDVCGRVEATGDRDYYAFTAKKDDVVVVEGLADRLRSPVDLFVVVRRAETGQTIGEFDDHPGMPPTASRFYTFTNDPLARVKIPADGRYELLVTSRDSLARGGPREVYCLRLREEQPDYQLVVVGNHESGAGLCLRRGTSHDVQVVCFRRDGFDAEVTLTAAGLPAGVTCEPQVFGPNLHQGVLVLTAAADAKDWAGAITITGNAVVNGKKLVREARAGCLVYPSPNENIPAVSRLARSVCLAVRDPGPFRLTAATEKEIAVPAGGSTSVKLKVDKLVKDYKDNVVVELAAGPPQQNGRPINAPKVNIGPGKEGEIKLQFPNNTPPGTYSLVFRGVGKLTVDDPATKKKKNTQFTAVSTPVALTVYNSACELTAVPVAVRPDTETPVVVKVKRLQKYSGEFTVELVPPRGSSGIGTATVKVPPGANEARLILKVDKNTKPAKGLEFQIRATAKVGNISLRTEEPLPITVDTLAKPAKTPSDARTVTLLPDGADGWRYSAAVTGDDWVKPDFDDKGWKAATAPLGYGETEIGKRKGTEIADKGQPVYARRGFEVSEDLLKQKGVTFRLRVASDNSAVVYLNGKAIDREDSDHEFSYWSRDVAVPAAALKPGRNVIAVRVNNGAGSSDVYLDLAVVASVTGSAANRLVAE